MLRALAEAGEVLRMRRRALADEHVEVRMVHVHAGLEPDIAEHGEDLDRVAGGVPMAVEPLLGAEVDRERAVHHHCGRREAEAGKRDAGRRDAAAGGDEDRYASPFELAPRGDRRGMRLLVAGPERSVEIGHDEIHIGHHQSMPYARVAARRIWPRVL